MTSSPDRKLAVEQTVEKTIAPLPPALSSMWRLCKLGYRHEPRLMLAALGLSQLAALPDALLALWLMLLGKGVLEHPPTTPQPSVGAEPIPVRDHVRNSGSYSVHTAGESLGSSDTNNNGPFAGITRNRNGAPDCFGCSKHSGQQPMVSV
jgi:hypothetical protein